MIIDELNFSYTNQEVLKNVSLSLDNGEFVGLVGPTGCGKTTLAYCLNGLIPNSIKGKFSGKVLVDGLDTSKNKVSEVARKVGLVFQDPDWQIFNLTVKDEVSFGVENLKLGKLEKRVKSALKMVGLTGFDDRDPNTLSQGQKQKLCIASILATDPEYIVLDEPTSQLDYKNNKKIHDILKRLNRRGKTILIIEHDTDFLTEYCDRILIMSNGRIVKDGKMKRVFSDVKLLKRLGIKVPR